MFSELENFCSKTERAVDSCTPTVSFSFCRADVINAIHGVPEPYFAWSTWLLDLLSAEPKTQDMTGMPKPSRKKVRGRTRQAFGHSHDISYTCMLTGVATRLHGNNRTTCTLISKWQRTVTVQAVDSPETDPFERHQMILTTGLILWTIKSLLLFRAVFHVKVIAAG